MDQVMQQIHQVLNQNTGNRLTPELVNGLTARLHAIITERDSQATAEQEKVSAHE